MPRTPRSWTHGPSLAADAVTFRLWAPAAKCVRLCIEGREPQAMHARENGFHELVAPGLAAGARYNFELEDGLRVPDPASRFQPDDVHGPAN